MALLPEFGIFRNQFSSPERKKGILEALGFPASLQKIDLRQIAPKKFGPTGEFFSPSSFLDFAAGRGATTLSDILRLLAGEPSATIQPGEPNKKGVRFSDPTGVSFGTGNPGKTLEEKLHFSSFGFLPSKDDKDT